jgi:Na+/H+ antiporter NhaD/arsenite permease-like protein
VPLVQLGSVGLLLLITITSSALTPRAVRQANDFSWHPMVEVATVFAAVFITIGPVEQMLEAGPDGPLAPLLRATRDSHGNAWPVAYFWLTGILSAFLDNAPTYLVFFHMAGIQPAVFFGGLTYIGNAPNMMLRAIAAHRGVRMPGFFGFMLMAMGLLLPVLGLVSVIFFSR